MPIEFIRVNREGKDLRGILHLPREMHPPCVIASHGLFSSKDSDKFVAIGEYFSERRIALIRYDHCGCGESDGDITDTTVTGRIADLNAMCAFARSHPLLGDRIGLLGSSMGGFISVLKAAVDREIAGLVLWATPATIREGRKQIEENAAEEGAPRMKKAFYLDARRYDAREAITRVSHCLILHGEMDEVVPVGQALELYAAALSPKEMEIFPGGDHRFTSVEDRRRGIEMSLQWFLRCFGYTDTTRRTDGGIQGGGDEYRHRRGLGRDTE